jgi:hypothetical protein
MYFHAFPKPDSYDSYELGMRAVLAGQSSIVETLKQGGFNHLEPTKQDKSQEIRYTRNAEFTPETLEPFLNNLPTPQEIEIQLRTRDESIFLDPRYY